MQKITSGYRLKNAIQLLEVKQAVDAQMLKDQFYFTCESLKPVNLLKRSLHDLTSSPNLIDTILSTAIGLGTGYLSKKIVVGTSGNILRKLLGLMLQVGVTKAVAQHPDAVKSFGRFIFHQLSRKKELNPIRHDG